MDAPIDEMLNPIKAPDCRYDGCTNPARFQYERVKEGASAYRTIYEERCVEHQLETFNEPNTFDERRIHRIYGSYKRTEIVNTPWWWPFQRTREDMVWAPLEMDPHYFCKKNGGEWCVDGFERSCPVHRFVDSKN